MTDFPLKPDVDVTISIVTWNSARDIAACLESIPAAVDGLRWHAVVVDNASSDSTVEIVRRRFPHIEVISNRRNVGFGAGHNQALFRGVGRCHFVLNPDTVLRPRAIRSLTRFVDEHPDVGLVGPRIYEADGSVYPSCRQFPTPGALLFRNKLLSRIFPRNPYTREYLMGAADHDVTLSVGWLSGSAILVTRKALERVRGFDERFFMYCEDMDWCRRTHDAGLAVCYHPEAEMVHLRARSTDLRIPAMILEHHRSMWKYYRKHDEAGRPRWFSFGVRSVLAARALSLVSVYCFRRLSRRPLPNRSVPARSETPAAVGPG